MAVDFSSEFDVPPIQVDTQRAAYQGRVIADRIRAAGGVDAAVDAAVAVIRAGGAADPPSELGRLRALYAEAYTDGELRSLVRNTFTALALASTEGE